MTTAGCSIVGSESWKLEAGNDWSAILNKYGSGGQAR
jgi:hypothetical protein